MVDQVNILFKKGILYRSIPLVFTVLFFLMIAPIPQLSFFHNIDPVLIFSGTLLFIIGIIFIIEFFRNLPDAGNHTGAKTGAYMFLVMGLITFAFGFGSVTGLYDPFSDSNDTVNLLLTGLLGLSSIILYASLHPILFRGKKNLAHMVRTG